MPQSQVGPSHMEADGSKNVLGIMVSLEDPSPVSDCDILQKALLSNSLVGLAMLVAAAY